VLHVFMIIIYSTIATITAAAAAAAAAADAVIYLYCVRCFFDGLIFPKLLQVAPELLATVGTGLFVILLSTSCMK